MPADDRRTTWELSRLSRRQRRTVPFQNRPRKAVFLLPASLLACWALAPPLQAAEDANSHRPAEFLRLCDLAVAELDKPVLPFTEAFRHKPDPTAHRTPFFEDAYGVRALCAAYDMTGRRQYLDACRRWAGRIADFQDKMIPQGAYYLNYYREPGKKTGDWFVADSGSVGMGVLAVAVRCDDTAEKQRYLDSVRAFARLVMKNYVGKGGGINDGLWSSYAGPYWCSSATFGAMAFLLYDATGDKRYLEVALGATDWLASHTFAKPAPPAFDRAYSGSVFYILEAYAAGWPHIKQSPPRRKAVQVQIAEALCWLEANQKGRGAKSNLDYFGNDTYMSGMPYMMYVLARQEPQYQGLRAAADQEVRYVAGELAKRPPLCCLTTWEAATWLMMSYAEQLRPGALFRAK